MDSRVSANLHIRHTRPTERHAKVADVYVRVFQNVISHLCGSCVVFERMHGQAEDVVIVAEVEPLAVLQPVVDDSHCGHVVHHLPRLSVEQVVATVEAPVPAGMGAVSEVSELKRKGGRSADLFYP